MTGKVGHWWLVETTPGVNVHGIDDLIDSFAAIGSRVRRLELAGWREKQTTIWCKGQSSEKGGKGLVGVNVGIAQA
jgi:hypothetical protein